MTHAARSPQVLAFALSAVLLGSCGGGGGGQAREASRDQGSNQSAESVSPREAKSLAVESLKAFTAHERPEIRANAIEALAPVRDAQLEPIIALGLADENEGVRAVAAVMAGRHKLTGVLPTLRSMEGREPSPYVRISLLYALHTMDSSTDLTPLARTMLSGQNISLSSHAAFVIGELGNSSALPLLKQASVQKWDGVSAIQLHLHRLQIAEAMIKLGDPLGYEAVRAALYPARPEELEATALAVQIIGEVKDRASIDQLIYMADEETGLPMPAEVRLAIASSLGKLGLGSGGYIADEFASNGLDVLRAQAASVYGDTGRREHVDRLVTMLRDDPSDLVRVSAAASLLTLLS